MLGLARVELPARAVGLKLRALKREALPRDARFVLVGELADRAGGRGDGRWGDGVKERVGDGAVKAGAAERAADPARRVR